MSQPVDIGALAGLFAFITALVVQFVKPFIDRIPAMQDPENVAVHDNLIRLLQFLINLGLLIAAARTVPAVFAGTYWWDIAGIAFGQAVFSHAGYRVLSRGGATTVPTLRAQVNFNPSTSAPSGLPTIPRG